MIFDIFRLIGISGLGALITICLTIILSHLSDIVFLKIRTITKSYKIAKVFNFVFVGLSILFNTALVYFFVWFLTR